MKNMFNRFSFAAIAAVFLLTIMAYTSPVAGVAKQYIILQDRYSADLQQEVNQKLAEGWQLQGGVSMGGNNNLVQAMVK
ncbi:MAG TPA: DUF1737 domain-containing protein [Chitinophagales bacterium]|nr:DUF1737 domain-containing protein [Chitinophagales bacterium]